MPGRSPPSNRPGKQRFSVGCWPCQARPLEYAGGGRLVGELWRVHEEVRSTVLVDSCPFDELGKTGMAVRCNIAVRGGLG